jgi:radical SAM protein (TIGR01212 family)
VKTLKTLTEYCVEQFGGKAYKLSLDGGMTCPNRDGTLDSRGCIFCSAGGSGDFAVPASADIRAQLEEAKKRVTSKYHGGKFIAYFQSYTNTYAPVERLRQLFTAAMEVEDVVCLSVATRPDCLPEEVLNLLGELNQNKPVWVELGLQTIHPKTAAFIRRGYPLEAYDRAVTELNRRGIHVITHVILGLPGESKEEMLETVRYVCASGSGGIKLQLLHVLEGTDLAEEYRRGNVPVLSLDEYAALVADCVAELPPDMVVHRLTGDGPKRILLAPQWSGDKKRVLNRVNRELEARGLR